MLLMIRLLVFKSSQVKIHETNLVPKIFSTIAWHVNNYIVHLFLEEKLLEHIFARKRYENFSHVDVITIELQFDCLTHVLNSQSNIGLRNHL